MTEQEIKDILQQQNHFFSSGKTIPAEFRLKQLESLKERLEIARKLKENGFSIADIVRVAGLSAEEIDKL